MDDDREVAESQWLNAMMNARHCERGYINTRDRNDMLAQSFAFITFVLAQLWSPSPLLFLQAVVSSWFSAFLIWRVYRPAKPELHKEVERALVRLLMVHAEDVRVVSVWLSPDLLQGRFKVGCAKCSFLSKEGVHLYVARPTFPLSLIKKVGDKAEADDMSSLFKEMEARGYLR